MVWELILSFLLIIVTIIATVANVLGGALASILSDIFKVYVPAAVGSTIIILILGYVAQRKIEKSITKYIIIFILGAVFFSVATHEVTTAQNLLTNSTMLSNLTDVIW